MVFSDGNDSILAKLSYVKYIIKLNFTCLDLHSLKANRPFPLTCAWPFCFHGAAVLWLSLSARLPHPRSEESLLSSVILLHRTVSCLLHLLWFLSTVSRCLCAQKGAAVGLVAVSAPSHEGDQPHAPWIPCRRKCRALIPLHLSWRELCRVREAPLSCVTPPLLWLSFEELTQ